MTDLTVKTVLTLSNKTFPIPGLILLTEAKIHLHEMAGVKGLEIAILYPYEIEVLERDKSGYGNNKITITGRVTGPLFKDRSQEHSMLLGELSRLKTKKRKM